MSETPARVTSASVGGMLLSAAIFGYFGFGMTFLGFGTTWEHRYTAPPPPAEPELLVMVALLMWTLRIAAIAFVLAAIVSSVSSARAGAALYGAVGLLAAFSLLSVAVWDWNSPYYSGVPPFLLLIFAVWNGFSSWAGLRESGVIGGPRRGA